MEALSPSAVGSVAAVGSRRGRGARTHFESHPHPRIRGFPEQDQGRGSLGMLFSKLERAGKSTHGPPVNTRAKPCTTASAHPKASVSVSSVRVAPVSPVLAQNESLEQNLCERRLWEVVEDLRADGGKGEEAAAGTAASRAVLSLLLRWAQTLAPTEPGSLPPLRARENRLMGCTAQVWARVGLQEGQAGGAPSLRVETDSDSAVMRGLCTVLRRALSGAPLADALALPPDSPALLALTQLLGPALGGGGPKADSPRATGLVTLLLSVQRLGRRDLAALTDPSLSLPPSLPSILISLDGSISAQGEFALSQAQYLDPSPAAVNALVRELSARRIGVVAHFYMDPEVQGVLVAAQRQWPHIAISDSLVMADKALAMVSPTQGGGGCQAVAVLGVDFMAENVGAVLEKGGMGHVPVLRMSAQPIGCSLADAARSAAYVHYLETASRTPKSLHVIYINTALDTKAVAHHFLPTITCTSSNVLQTVLQAFAQVPDATVWFGPDTYMGGNLVEMLGRLSSLPEEDVRALHPQHTPATLKALVPRVKYFKEGVCIVHDMFGSEVVHQLRTAYPDAFHTAHFEVPGAMFALAMEARARGRGTVGSTQNILDFILARTREALGRGFEERLQFVLGTESGMVTAIVTAVRNELEAARRGAQERGDPPPKVEVEIVFPVNSSAITNTTHGGEGTSSPAVQSVASTLRSGLEVVPGAAAGEGCSMEGGCASCPYMKMNSLDALMRVAQLVSPGSDSSALSAYEPDKFAQTALFKDCSTVSPPDDAASSAAPSVADLGYVPILNMRHFQKSGSFSEDLVQDMETRWQK